MPQLDSVWTLVLSVLGSTGICTLVMKFMVESALKEAREKRELETHRRQERYKLEDEYRHDIGRCLFWLWHGAKEFERDQAKGYWNGELESAIAAMNATEKKQKELDQQQLAELNEPK